jgi:hypothetical protein
MNSPPNTMGGFSFSAGKASLDGKEKRVTTKINIKTMIDFSLIFISYLPVD